MRFDTKSFITRATNKHGERFDYSETVCTKAVDRVRIRCIRHNYWFEQITRNHLLMEGCCPKCTSEIKQSNLRSNTETWRSQATKVHAGKYSYDASIYIGGMKKIAVECLKHGTFRQGASEHLMGKGCPKCAACMSKPELRWLAMIGLENKEYRYIRIGGKNFKPDGIDGKRIYEFYGDFFHGNPDLFPANEFNRVVKKTQGEIYTKTMAKEEFLKCNGYDVIHIWESEFKRIEEFICSYPDRTDEIIGMLKIHNGDEIIRLLYPTDTPLSRITP